MGSGCRVMSGGVLLAAVLALPGQTHAAPGDPAPALWEVVLIGMRPARELDTSRCDAQQRPCVRKYLTAVAASPYLQSYRTPNGPEEAAQSRRRNLAEQMAALLGAGARTEAAAFADSAPLGVEWEGMSDGPLEEAAFAETWLARYPQTALAPFLHLFRAYRLRAAFETTRSEKLDTRRQLAEQYADALEKARSSTNGLIACIAEDLDTRAYVYLEGRGRPCRRFSETFRGRVTKGERFRQQFGPGFEFTLEPAPHGWEIVVREQGRNENLARLTPPLHGAPNPREIEGWHLSENPGQCASRLYQAQEGPSNLRQFIFSPEVGRGIDGPAAKRAVEPADIEAVSAFGKGRLTIAAFELGPPDSDGCPAIARMEFSVEVQGGH